MNSHSRCRIGANACGRSQRASHKPSANRWSIRAQRLAHSRLSPGISAAAFPARSDRRCSQRLAKPRSRGRMRRAAWRAPTVEARPANPIACAMCGEPVLKRRRRHCEACMPKARREHGLRAIEAARKALAAQTAAGNDPRRSADVNRARGEAISEAHRRNRRWAREHPGQRDEAWFKREIAPKLDGFTLKEIAGRRAYRSRPARASGPARGCRIRTALGSLARAGRSRELSLSAERP